MRESLDIEGTWEDEWGGTQNVMVTAFDWNARSLRPTTTSWLIIQNGPDSWSPDLWSKYEWTWDEENNLYYCQSTYDAETEEDAVSAACRCWRPWCGLWRLWLDMDVLKRDLRLTVSVNLMKAGVCDGARFFRWGHVGTAPECRSCAT